MKQYPNIYSLDHLMRATEGVAAEIGGEWMPARPLGYPSLGQRFRAAWLVFRGKADAVTWPGGQ